MMLDLHEGVSEIFLDAQAPVFEAVREAFIKHFEQVDPAKALVSDYVYAPSAKALDQTRCRRYYAKNAEAILAKKREKYGSPNPIVRAACAG